MAAENNIVGEVGLLVKPVDPNAQFQRGVDDLIKRLEKQAQFQVKAAGIEQMQNDVNGLANGFAQAAIQAGAVTAAVYGIRAAVQGTLGKFQGLFDQLRQAQAGFASILKSDAAGGALLAQIQEFARVSPFVTQELVNYSQQLLGVGVSASKIVPLLEDVGNIVSSVGGDTQNIGRVLFTLTQIQSIGRLAGQDAMQLQSALIPITKYLSEYLNKTTAEVKKLQEQGAISADTVFAAIQAQGDKVEGAMSNATRNIGGARAVLSDTITLMKQNQPVLNKINDDIYKAILKLSETISSPEFTQGFNRFFDSIEKVYEELGPFIAELSKLGGSTIITGLGQTSVLFGVFGDVLSALPEPVLEALARLLVAIATLKAPLMLVQYVQNIQRMSTALVPAVSGLARLGGQAQANIAPLNAEAAAIDKTTAALLKQEQAQVRQTGIRSRLQQISGAGGGKAAALGLVAATAAGSYLAGSDDPTTRAAGSALTLGATGFMLAGPAGGAAGAAIGAITSFINSAEEEARRHVEEMKKLGTDAATSFIEEEGKKFQAGGTLGETQTSYETQIRDIEARRRAAQSVVDATRQNGAAGFGDKIGGATLGRIGLYDDSDRDEAQAAVASLEGVNAELKAIEDAAIAAFEPVTIGIKNIVDGLDRTQPAFDRLTMNTGHAGRVATTDIGQAEEAFKKYGVALDEVADPANWDRINALISAFDGLTTAQQNATRTANEWNTAYKDALTAANAIFEPEIAQIGSRIAAMNAQRQAYEANVAAGKNLTDPLTDLSGDKSAEEARRTAYALSLAESADNISRAGDGLRKDQRDAAEAAARSAANLRAAAAGERAYATAIAARGATEIAMANLTAPIMQTRVDELVDLAGVVDQLDNRTIIVELITNNIQAEVEKLLEYQRIAADIAAGIFKPGGSRAGTLDPTKSVADGGTGASQRAQREIDILTGKVQATSEYDKSVIAGNVTDPAAKAIWERDKAERDRLEAEAKRLADEAARKAQEWADAVENSTEALANAVEAAADAITAAADRWIGSIKERTQYETAVSAGRLTRNANRQLQDLQELGEGMSNLRARGVTDEVLKALGIDNVADVRQVRKLVRSSDSDLAALTSSVSGLNSEAAAIAQSEEDKRTRDNIAQAIIEAAKTLGIDKPSKDQASTLAAQFNITPGLNAEEVALAILNQLSAGRIGA